MSEDKTRTDSPEPVVSTVNFRPIHFVPRDPEVWLAALELQFMQHRITSQRRQFALTLEAIPGEYLCAVRELVLHPPEEQPFDKLKAALLKYFLPPREEQLRELLARHPIGDAKPSQHLARLRALAGPDNSHSSIIQELWMDALPVYLKATVTALLEDSTLDKVAPIADKIVARVGNNEQLLVASTSHQLSSRSKARSSQRGPPRCIHERLSFKDKVDVPEPYPSRGRSQRRRGKSPQSTRRLSKPPKPHQGDGYCWFHKTYGSAARRCKKPCAYPAGNASTGE